MPGNWRQRRAITPRHRGKRRAIGCRTITGSTGRRVVQFILKRERRHRHSSILCILLLLDHFNRLNSRISILLDHRRGRVGRPAPHRHSSKRIGTPTGY